jgi:hypothetical protein
MTGPNDDGQVTDVAFEAQLSLQRILPQLESVWQSEPDTHLQREFLIRLQRHWPDLFAILLQLYGTRYDFFYHIEQILITAAQALRDRPRRCRNLIDNASTTPHGFNHRNSPAARCMWICSATTSAACANILATSKISALHICI